MTEIGKNICKRRKELGLTQEELAFKLGYKSKSSINKIELGFNDLPQRKIVQFAEALRTTPGYLMGWVKEEQLEEDIKKSQSVDLAIRMFDDPAFAEQVERLNSDALFAEVVSMIAEMSTEELSGLRAILRRSADK